MPSVDLSVQTAGSDDEEILEVERTILAIPNVKSRFERVLRDTIDQLLDGERTGRYDFKTLRKTEKTHAGTLVEINLQREFDNVFLDGVDMDYKIAGIEVDCKYSKDLGGWMIPPEALGEVCLLVWFNDDQSLWSAGLIRVDLAKLEESEARTRKGNRDCKYRLNAKNLHLVRWLWDKAALPMNVLLHLGKLGISEAAQAKILTPGKNQGQPRVNELFRAVHGVRIGRGVVRTVAQQVDYMARIREDNEGRRARPALRKEGIVILGDYAPHQDVARALGGPVPQEGEFVAFRLVRRRLEHGDRPWAVLDGEEWVVADANDPPGGEAPRLPNAQGTRASSA